MNGAPGAGGYGNAAYAALSLFLMVSVNKAKTEELIDTMMHRLQQEYYRIKIVNKVHPTDRMKEQTAVVYRLGVEFLYTAVGYYSMTTFRRLWHVVARPPSIELTEKISEIQIAVEEIRKEMEVLDSERLKEIEVKLDDQSSRIDQQAVKIARTEKDVQALRKEVDRERLEHLQQLLGVTLDEVDPSIRRYDDLLNETFKMRTLGPFDVQKNLYENKFFRMWHQTDDLQLIVLQGSTIYPPNTDLSWLSSGATHVILNAFDIFQARQHRRQTKDFEQSYLPASQDSSGSIFDP
ncbi:hypothetical protein GRF29_28g503323 [Pseudopithomyces chartarum]|uniref:DUF7708 domain-containing protein n=1 Tax=Pseudopithomyces chartarum TaxID=1892770 RepID=A0AAN6M3I4_9PLEO|nr:hypothetical protein GRF29_28g503323 [Pseudopithomyces chartarum]